MTFLDKLARMSAKDVFNKNFGVLGADWDSLSPQAQEAEIDLARDYIRPLLESGALSNPTCVFNDVFDFNTKTGIVHEPLSNNDTIKIISEELVELVEGFLLDDEVKIADALVDIVYATLSCADRLDFPMEELWRECHRSNMTKVGAPIVNGKLQKGDNFEQPDFGRVLGY